MTKDRRQSDTEILASNTIPSTERPVRLPFLLLLVPGSLLLSLAGWRFRIRLGGKKVAVLGDRTTGKSTLLAHLRETGSRRARAGSDGTEASDAFAINVKGGSVEFKFPVDLSGHDGLGLSEWKKAFVGSHHVWYLFRADLIAEGDRATTEMVRTHIDTFRNWLKQDRFSPPKITLIGTFADESPAFKKSPDSVLRAVGESPAIKIGTVKLNNAALVIGSLQSPKDRTKLVSDLSRVL